MTYNFDYYYDLYENISLQEYLKDKTVEDIVSTCKWLNAINEHVFAEMLAYFNKEPSEDLKYTDARDEYCDYQGWICPKCLFPHDDTHKCYAYDRIFRAVFIGLIGGDYHYVRNTYTYCCGNERTTCYNAAEHDKIGRYEYGEEDCGCAGSMAVYVRIGFTWFERKCDRCPEMKIIGNPYKKFQWLY